MATPQSDYEDDIIINVDTGNEEIAPETVKRVGKTANPRSEKAEVQDANEISQDALNADFNCLETTAALGNEQYHEGQPKINPGTSNIPLNCSTEKAFQDNLKNYEPGRMKESCEEQLPLGGYKVKEQKIASENTGKVNQTKEPIPERPHTNHVKNEAKGEAESHPKKTTVRIK